MEPGRKGRTWLWRASVWSVSVLSCRVVHLEEERSISSPAVCVCVCPGVFSGSGWQCGVGRAARQGCGTSDSCSPGEDGEPRGVGSRMVVLMVSVELGKFFKQTVNITMQVGT